MSNSSTLQACSNCGETLTSEACDGCGYSTNPEVTGHCIACNRDITENDVNIVGVEVDGKFHDIHPGCLEILSMIANR